jgi:hypothetical protein
VTIYLDHEFKFQQVMLTVIIIYIPFSLCFRDLVGIVLLSYGFDILNYHLLV